MGRNTLFKKFILQSILSFSITGVLLAYFVSNLVINQEIKHNIEIVTLTLDHSLERWLEEVDINDLSEIDLLTMDKEFIYLNELGSIADIRIWGIDGNLAYSQDKGMIGQLIIEDEHVIAVLEKGSDYELTSADSDENNMLKKHGNELIEIYIPITKNFETVGFFEVYRSFDESRDSINTSLRNIFLILSAGLLILYFFLAKTIYSSSKKLIHQTEEITISYDKLNKLFNSIIKAITKAIDARDKFTSGHSQRVAEYTVGFAKYLKLEDKIINRLEIAALLHDIGKLGVPESIINKPGKLTDEEFNLMKQHPSIGEQIIVDIEELHDILDIIKYHHEKFKGEGYPSNIHGDEIPYLARVITITDAFDAMISNRPYRNGLPLEVAIAEIEKYAGTQFDPQLAKQFVVYLSKSKD